MKISFLILLNKSITKVCNIFKRDGSVFPASIVRKIDKNILEYLKYPKYVIGVTGSSGKGSTTSMIAHILKQNGYKVAWNKNGSNVVNGTTTLILNNTSIFTHRVKCDVLLLEIDESYIKETFKNGELTHLVITNITRDQPARNGSPEIVLEKIKSSISPNTTLILNVDDPFVNRFTLLENKSITYGINKNKYSIKVPYSDNLDAAYCPICHAKLEYSYYHYGHFGSYKCPNKDFSRKTTYSADNINLDTSTMDIESVPIKLNKNAFFTTYYHLAAYSVAKTLGLTDENIIKTFNDNTLESKRLKSISFDKRDVYMIESKNENNLSYLQSLNYINNYKDKKTIIMGFDNVSRRYKYNDISWLYDVDFEVLKTKEIDKIFCIGRFRYDVYSRLLLAGIKEEKLVLVNNIEDITKMLLGTSGTIFTMVCFDMTAVLKKLFMEEV